MALDPQAANVIDLVVKSGRPPYHLLSPKEARQMFRDTRPAPKVSGIRHETIGALGSAVLCQPVRTRAGVPLGRLESDRVAYVRPHVSRDDRDDPGNVLPKRGVRSFEGNDYPVLPDHPS